MRRISNMLLTHFKGIEILMNKGGCMAANPCLGDFVRKFGKHPNFIVLVVLFNNDVCVLERSKWCFYYKH